MNVEDLLQQIDNFESHYQYDSTYMREMLETSPAGYNKFNNAMSLVGHRELLDKDTYWVAKLAAMRSEDCGECLQLNVRMAKESDVDTEVIRGAISQGQGLADALKDVHDYAVGVSLNSLTDSALVARVESRLNKGQLLELGVCVSTAKLFPVIKRAVGYTKSCSLIEISV